jgi:hypothetical protein
MRPTRAALLVVATALTPALLLTAPAFAADASASATTRSATSTTPITPTPAAACLPTSSGTGAPVDEMTADQLLAAIQNILADENAGPSVRSEANEALDGTVDDMRAFLETGCRTAQATDDRIYIFTILGDPNISEAMYDAIQVVLSDGSPEALRRFRTVGQYEVDG